MQRGLDFIVIGAQKAGTTSLFEYLRRHPELELPASKEVPYFSHDANYERPWGEYLRKSFPFANPDCKWGTVTPHYMYGGIVDAADLGRSTGGDERTVPRRIREKLPSVRLVAIVRDPVARARSHHAMATLNGWEQRTFDEAINELLLPEALHAARRLPEETTGYVVWGEYGRLLGGYLEVFPRDQLLVLFTDDLQRDPEGTLRRVYEHVGVDPTFVPDNVGIMYRTGATGKRLRWLDPDRIQARVSRDRFSRSLWHALPESTRRRIDRAFNRVNYQLGLWNRRAGSETPMTRQSMPALRAHYESDARRLEELLGGASVGWGTDRVPEMAPGPAR